MNPKNSFAIPFMVGAVFFFFGVHCGMAALHRWRDGRRVAKAVPILKA
jgi:hypothetical protein